MLSTHKTETPFLIPIPLYLMEKRQGSARDFILVNSPSLVQSAANGGYSYAGRQG